MAKQQQQYQGLLERYNLPTMTRDEFFHAQDKQFVQRPMNGREALPHEKAGRSFGMLLGQKLFNKGRDRQLPEGLDNRFAVVENAQNRFNKLRTESPDLWGSLSSEEKALTYRRYLADAAAESGEADLAAALNDEYTAAYNAQIQQNLELEKLGIENQSNLEELQHTRYKNNVARTYGVPMTGYPLGSDDPNTGVAGTQLPDNSFRYIDPMTGKERVLPPGHWSPSRPQRPPQPRKGGESGGGGSEPVYTTNEVRLARNAVVSTSNQLRVSLDMYDLMSEIAQEYGSIEFMSTAGNVTSFTTKMVENVAAITRTAKQLAIPYEGADGEVAGRIDPDRPASWDKFKRTAVGKNWMEDFEADLQSNKHLRDTFITAEQWGANVVRLAYARARAREPGARQLSDNDIQQARAELGAMTTDPEAFRQIMLTGMGSDLEQLEQSIELMTSGLSEKQMNALFGPEGMKRYTDLRDRFYSVYRDGGSFGTAPNPGPGLIAPSGAPAAQPGQNTQPQPNQGQGRLVGYDENGNPLYLRPN